MLEEDLEVAIKVVVVGNGAVGKSSMIQRYCKGIFTKEYKKTIGVDFLEKQICHNENDVRLMLWDTAGQEEFDSITKAYYRGAQACVLAFSTTDRDSFEAIEKWKSKVEEEVGPNIPLVLVQNKIDLLEQAVVEQEEAENLAKKLKLRFYRTSVKEDLNVTEVFQYLTEKHVQKTKQDAELEPETTAPIRQIGLFNTTSANSSKSNNKNGSSTPPGGETISLQPSKSRVASKSKNPFSRCKFF
uniref:Ras-related protein Rab-23 n=1 Tax=Phallusia mammillata TaxID=59560 RepID=A0A6F9DPI5_9ASCI|nr:ras-related protein Rab-23-like [Phallusia mammillata]